MNYLQFNDKGKFEPEEQALANYFGEGNYTGFYKKHFLRDKFQITKNDFISGDIDVMFHAMKRLGIEYSYNDYPECLKPYLHRKIWESTLGEVRKRLFDDLGNEVELGLNWFIKPKDKLKRFTGFVCETIDDLSKCAGAGNQTKIWCSEPVRFTSEFRCYFIKKEEMAQFETNPIRKLAWLLEEEVTDVYINPYQCFAIGNYKSYNKDDLDKIKEFIQDELLSYRDMMHEFHPEKNWPFYQFPVSFALDLGILSTGEIALVEMNDAFSIGKYNGIDDETYAKFLITRWNELKKEN